MKKYKMFMLNAEYPVYDDNDNIIGKTNPLDVGIVLSEDDGHEYDNYGIGRIYKGFNKNNVSIDMKLLTGDFAGYDRLCLDYNDINKLTEVQKLRI